MLEVLEAMRSQVLAHFAWEVMLHQVAGRLRKQHLSSVASAHDACGSVNIQADIAFVGTLGLTGMQTHTDAHRHPMGKRMRNERTLGSYRGLDGIGGASEGYEESIALRVNDVPVPLRKRGP